MQVEVLLLQDTEPSADAIKAKKPKADTVEAAFDKALKIAEKVTNPTSAQLFLAAAVACSPNNRLAVMITSRCLPAPQL